MYRRAHRARDVERKHDALARRRCVLEREVEGAVEHTYISHRNPAYPVGQRFCQKLRMGKSVKEFQAEIIAWEAPTHFGLYIPSPAYSSEAHFRISPQGPTRSSVDYSIDITLHRSFVRLLSPVLRVPLSFFVKKQIGRLKAYAERLQRQKEAS